MWLKHDRLIQISWLNNETPEKRLAVRLETILIELNVMDRFARWKFQGGTFGTPLTQLDLII